MNTDKFIRLVEIRKQLELLSKEEAELKEELTLQIPDEGLIADGYKFIRVEKKTFKLKEGINQEDVLDKFPMCIKTSVDMTALKKEPEAHELLEPVVSVYMMMKAQKDDGNN